MKPPKIKFNHWLPKLIGFGAIILGRYMLFANSKQDLHRDIIKHEFFHHEEREDIGTFAWYLGYVIKWIKCLFKYRNFGDAYYLNPYEQRAYNHDSDPFTKDELKWLDMYDVKI